MFITVTCPKCGRGIKVKKKYALSTGGIPCLKCKVRIPVTREEVEAYSPAGPAAEQATEELPEAAPATGEPLPAQTGEETAPDDDEAVSEPIPVPEPEPEPAPEPVPEPEPAPEPVPAALPDTEDADTITPVLASSPGPEAPASESAPTPVGPQITFTCPHCQTTYPMRQTLAGKKIRCKGCSRIVKVAADSPVIPGAEPPPPPPPEDDDIPVIFSPAEAPDPALASVFSRPAPTPLPVPTPTPVPAPPPVPTRQPFPEGASDSETVAQLRKALAEAEERANSAEELLQHMTREKTNTEMASFRKVRDLEAQLRELGKANSGTLKRSEVESLLKTLCEALDANLKQEISAHQNLVDDLKRQLTQALH